jgi:beta-xylosidase
VDAGWFQGGVQWSGDFGDPTIVRVGGTYYAYSSPTGGRYLPVLTSTDLETWVVHPNWSDAGPPNRSGYSVRNDSSIPAEIRSSNQSDWDTFNLNDALVKPASWGLEDTNTGPWMNRDLWAPGVIAIGDTWYAYHAVRISWGGDDPNHYGRFCLTVASAPSPMGPFRDISGDAPIQCEDPAVNPSGSIDPFPYFDQATGRTYLLWKAAGMVGVRESSIKAVELGRDGKPVPGAQPVTLLETNRADPWEGGTIENPSMVTYGGVTYLFYSANSSLPGPANISPYATGYAVCDAGPRGACRRVQGTPLFSSGGTEQGPGGSSGFVTADNQLRVAYATFWLGEERSPAPRRMHIAKIEQHADGTLASVGEV